MPRLVVASVFAAYKYENCVCFRICRTINLTGSRMYRVRGGHCHFINVSLLSVLSSSLCRDNSSKAKYDASEGSRTGVFDNVPNWSERIVQDVTLA